jgi:hypothetical protein
MDWKDVGKAVKKYAPVLGSAVAGPAGGAIGGAVSLIASAFGIGDDEPTADQIYQAIQMDPESAIKLKEIEANHKIELEKLILDRERMHLADRADARAREASIVKATGKKDINLYVLAWSIVFGFFALTFALMYRALPEGSTDAVFMLFGGLVSGFTGVIQYFFGSSKSSADKTALLGRGTK